MKRTQIPAAKEPISLIQHKAWWDHKPAIGHRLTPVYSDTRSLYWQPNSQRAAAVHSGNIPLVRALENWSKVGRQPGFDWCNMDFINQLFNCYWDRCYWHNLPIEMTQQIGRRIVNLRSLRTNTIRRRKIASATKIQTFQSWSRRFW